ncbi:hypothetical protein ANO14919_015850 [Xylariales sp. No.14919]|nr:hypothetical protein ANO14919_015850 [Xylariales sp. No.14919]
MLLKPILTLLLAVTTGLPSQEHIPNANITWTGRAGEGGDILSLTGLNLQHIEAQLRETNSEFSWSQTIEPGYGNSLAESDVLCDMSWNPSFASVFHIRQGIAYLHKIHGDCTNGPGPGNCSRVSCSYHSGIWFCNDNPHPVSVPCSTFGDRAWDIIQKCYSLGESPDDLVHGQVFDTDGWNVIVAGADC